VIPEVLASLELRHAKEQTIAEVDSRDELQDESIVDPIHCI